MEGVLQAIRALSIISVILAAVWMLVPKGLMEKSMKYVLGIFLIVSIISVITSIAPADFNIPEVSSREASGQAQTASAELDRATVEYTVGCLLDEAGIYYSKIEATMDNSDDSGIHITNVEVILDNQNDFERAYELVKRETGLILTGD